MPPFLPFAGIRYDTSTASLADLTAPPYDVIDDDQRAALAARHPHNAVHIDLPVDTDGVDRYDVARQLLHDWLDDGTLRQDPTPVFYGYRMAFVDAAGRHRHTTGVIGALELSRPDEGQILPHEHTTPKAKSDRLQMLRSCEANLSAIWALTPATGLTALVGAPGDGDPVWLDDDGVEHALWVIRDAATVAAISEAVGSHPVVIADGHHRFETSLAYRDERRLSAETTSDSGIPSDGDRPSDSASPSGDEHPADPAGAAAATMTYVVELVADELTVWPTHRIIESVDDADALAPALERWFEMGDEVPLDEHTVDTMIDSASLVLVERGVARAMRPRPHAFEGVRDLDTSRVDAALADLGSATVRYHHDIDEVRRSVESGRAVAGILVRPATVEAIAVTADGGERMPPKTTFFHPKPRTGQVFRLLS